MSLWARRREVPLYPHCSHAAARRCPVSQQSLSAQRPACHARAGWNACSRSPWSHFRAAALAGSSDQQGTMARQHRLAGYCSSINRGALAIADLKRCMRGAGVVAPWRGCQRRHRHWRWPGSHGAWPGQPFWLTPRDRCRRRPLLGAAAPAPPRSEQSRCGALHEACWHPRPATCAGMRLLPSHQWLRNSYTPAAAERSCPQQKRVWHEPAQPSCRAQTSGLHGIGAQCGWHKGRWLERSNAVKV